MATLLERDQCPVCLFSVNPEGSTFMTPGGLRQAHENYRNASSLLLAFEAFQYPEFGMD